jgi:hypothetical protein
MTLMTARKRFTSVLAASALALALAGCGDDPDPVADDTGSDESSESTPSEEPSEPTSPPESSAPAAELTTVPVYFKVEADNPLEEAAALMTAGDALDGDYGTAYPEGSFASVEYADGTLVATLSDNAWTKKIQGMTAKQVQLAVQQLVYTLQGVQQERAPVVVQLDGQPTTLFGVDTADGLEAAKELNVLALVNVTTPEESQAVTGTFTAEGVASSFEATVPWQIRQGDQVVKEGFSTALGWVDKLYPWQTDVDVSDLEPGEYTFVALTDDPSGGEGGGPTEDTKTIIVK